MRLKEEYFANKPPVEEEEEEEEEDKKDKAVSILQTAYMNEYVLWCSIIELAPKLIACLSVVLCVHYLPNTVKLRPMRWG